MTATLHAPDPAAEAGLHHELDGREFELVVRRLANSLDLGSDQSPHLGSGTDYAQSRPFTDGDDVRAIDWRVTARTGRWYVKEYETLRRMPVILVVDTSTSMRLGSLRPTKFDLAVRLAGGLALAAVQRSSPVGLVGAGASVLRHPPCLSSTQVFVWLHQLRRLARTPGSEGTRLAQRLDEVGARLPCRSLVLVLSDLHDDGAEDALRRLHLAHDCVVLALRDPVEDGALGAGFIEARAAESAVRHRLTGGSRWSATGPTVTALARAGIDALALPIDQPVIDRVSRFLAMRSRRARGGR